MKRKKAGYDRHKEHAAAYPREHGHDSDAEAEDEQKRNPGPPRQVSLSSNRRSAPDADGYERQQAETAQQPAEDCSQFGPALLGIVHAVGATAGRRVARGFPLGRHPACPRLRRSACCRDRLLQHLGS